jgi:hypothetical protein
VRGLRDSVRPIVLAGVERALGLGDHLLGPVHVDPLPHEQTGLPPGHRDAVERPVLVEFGSVLELVEELGALAPQSLQEVQKESNDDDGDDHDEDDQDDLRATQGHHWILRHPFRPGGTEPSN